MKEKIVVGALKELLRQIVENQNRIADLLEEHRHDKEGKVMEEAVALRGHPYDYDERGLASYDVNNCFVTKVEENE